MPVVWAGVATPPLCTLLPTAIDAYPELATPTQAGQLPILMKSLSLHIGKWPFGLLCGFSLSVSLGRLSWGTGSIIQSGTAEAPSTSCFPA